MTMLAQVRQKELQSSHQVAFRKQLVEAMPEYVISDQSPQVIALRSLIS
jgi:hypothetical protein